MFITSQSQSTTSVFVVKTVKPAAALEHHQPKIVCLLLTKHCVFTTSQSQLTKPLSNRKHCRIVTLISVPFFPPPKLASFPCLWKRKRICLWEWNFASTVTDIFVFFGFGNENKKQPHQWWPPPPPTNVGEYLIYYWHSTYFTIDAVTILSSVMAASATHSAENSCFFCFGSIRGHI
jgi:hypothetical protein